MQTESNSSMVFVDGHVHIHTCFNIENFFYSAANNFRNTRKKYGANLNSYNILLLTETSSANYFEQLFDLADTNSQPYNSLSVHRTNENNSLLVKLKNEESLFLVAGRQIVTSERLEVLALCTEQRFKDAEPIIDVIDNVKKLGALAVIPWGFGKWLGRRGKIVEKLINNYNNRSFYLGDNSGRAAFLPMPGYLTIGKEKGITILPGSDPLPFNSEFWRPGSFGFGISGKISPENPAADFKRLLNKQNNSIKSFGKLERPVRFFRNQIAMQFMKNKC